MNPFKLDHYYPCRFPPRFHQRSQEALVKIQAYYIANILKESESLRKKYQSQQLEEFFLLIFPGALNDRIDVACIYYEFFFFFDDYLEKLDQKAASLALTHIFGILNETRTPDSNNQFEVILHDVASMLLAVGSDKDHELARRVLSATSKFLAAVGSQQRRYLLDFHSYLEIRIVDAAAWVAIALIIWSYGVYLPPHMEDDRDIDLLAKKASLQAILNIINDLYSYRAELLRTQNSTEHFFIAVPIIMREQQLGAQEAMDYLKVYISIQEDEFVEISDRLRGRYSENASELNMINTLVEAYGYMMSGN